MHSFEERENKQKNAKFWLKNLELSFFSDKIAVVMHFCQKRNITLNYAMFININGPWQCLQVKTYYNIWVTSALFIVQSFPKWFLHFWMTFCKISIRISCHIIFVNKHCPQSCPSPFNLCVSVLEFALQSGHTDFSSFLFISDHWTSLIVLEHHHCRVTATATFCLDAVKMSTRGELVPKLRLIMKDYDYKCTFLAKFH